VDEIPQASLADMAFLLLIFFIATTTFAFEFGLPMVLPSARAGVAVEVRPSQVFRIQGHADQTVTVDGVLVPVASIADLLRSRNAERGARGEDELVVLIETHPRAAYELMVEILDQVRQANSLKVSLQLLVGS
jgi:biopolymer transport protein ExbD